MSFLKAVIVLSSAKLYNENSLTKPTRSLINILNSNGSRIDHWGMPESSVWNVLCMLFAFPPFKIRIKEYEALSVKNFHI